MCANVTKLMHAGKAAKDRPVTDMHMACQGRIVGHDRLITNDAIVGNMHIRHDPVVITQNGLTFVLRRTATNRAVFANRVSITDDQSGWLTSIFLILWVVTDRCELVDMIVFADNGGAIDHNVTFDTCAISDFNVVTDN